MVVDTSPRLIPVTLLTGFLGSGKTTLLNHLVQQPEMADTLVIINEFGEVSLDHLLIAHSTENLVLEMNSGCVCCTIRGDLVKTLRDITWRFSRNGDRQFKRVLIETTGLADPAPIIHTLMTHPQIAARYRLDGIVATVDAQLGWGTLDQHREAVKQAAVADVILLTKTDLAPPEQVQRLEDRLTAINPAAVRWHTDHGHIAPHQVLDLGLFSGTREKPDVTRWLKESAYQPLSPFKPSLSPLAAPRLSATAYPEDVNRHDDHIRAFCFVVDEPIPDEVLTLWLEILTSFAGRDILRVKGILNIEGRELPVVLHGVQHIFHPPITLPAWPSEDRRSRIVFITHDVEPEVVDQAFTSLRQILDDPRFASI